MLKTPLGGLKIQMDGKDIPYTCEKVDRDRSCPELDGRWALSVECKPDGAEHTISCRIEGYVPSAQDMVEGGEDLELKSFYRGDCKLSLGMEGDSCYLDGERLSSYDYDTAYLDDGVQYALFCFTKTRRFVFGAAWLEHRTEDNDLQTWFGADPTLFENV